MALRSVEKLHRHVVGRKVSLPDIRSFIAETPMTGCQVNIDGFAQNGKVTILGVVDAVMYPGTHAFKRFEFPSRLPQAAQDAAAERANQLLEALGYAQGFFNVEAFVEPGNTVNRFEVRIIEINPRMARQLTSIYQAVKEFDCWNALMALACGLPVQANEKGSVGHAASFVRRSFDGALPASPTAAQVAQVYAQFPEARLHLYLSPRGFGKARELKWVGSYRYAVTNLAAASRKQLFERYEEVLNTLGWESEYREAEQNPCEALTLRYCAQATAK